MVSKCTVAVCLAHPVKLLLVPGLLGGHLLQEAGVGVHQPAQLLQQLVEHGHLLLQDKTLHSTAREIGHVIEA